jgi:hypothetical protein
MYGYLCTKYHDDISIFGSRQYLKYHTLNSYNLTTNKNIHIPITYYDMKYLCLYVYQFSWGYLNIGILNILEKHDEIVCIWWLIIEHTTLLWEVNTQGENTPGTTKRPLSFGKWIRENMEKTLPPMFCKLQRATRKEKWVRQVVHSPPHESTMDRKQSSEYSAL